MNEDNEELYIKKCLEEVEKNLNWGESQNWTNYDFEKLSLEIERKTKVVLSETTLKRIWGKVKYPHKPALTTLNTLAQFLAYEDWRAFKQKNNSNLSLIPLEKSSENIVINSKSNTYNYKIILISLGFIILTGIFLFLTYKKNEEKPTPISKINPKDYKFISKKVVAAGVPNSVIFDYDASAAPNDSVFFQQSWNPNERIQIPKNQKQYTSIYYFPGFFLTKLIIGNQIIKEQALFIKSDGWLTVIEQNPIPIYFTKEESFTQGKMNLSIEKIKNKGIDLQPNTPNLHYRNVKDFGEIYTDDFVFEARLKNDFKEGSAICQHAKIYILCEGMAIGMPLSAKGCVSDLGLLFAQYSVSGKEHDLSAFGVDFNDFVKIRIESKNQKTHFFVNDKLAYVVDKQEIKAKIIGIDFTFQGSGTVDYVKLQNSKVNFVDEF